MREANGRDTGQAVASKIARSGFLHNLDLGLTFAGSAWMRPLPIEQALGYGLGASSECGWLHVMGAQDVKDRRTAREQVVGDDPPVASPPEDFRTHDRAGAFAGLGDQFGEPFPEWRRQRVVRVVPETSISPERVRRNFGVGLASAQSTQGRDVAIPDLPFAESVRKGIAVELRVCATDRVECPMVKNGRISLSASANMSMIPARRTPLPLNIGYHRGHRAGRCDVVP